MEVVHAARVREANSGVEGRSTATPPGPSPAFPRDDPLALLRSGPALIFQKPRRPPEDLGGLSYQQRHLELDVDLGAEAPVCNG